MPGISKTLSVAAFSLVVLCSPSLQAADATRPVLLRWNVPADRPQGFRTAMDISKSPNDPLLQIDMAELAAKGALSPELDRAVAALQPPETYSMMTVLRCLPNGNFSAKLIVANIARPTTPDPEMQKKLDEMWQTTEGTVQLRGELTPSGKVASFFLKNDLRNLLALFFELPQNPVRVGDAWALDVNLISLGTEFICEKANRTNRVELVSLTGTNEGETLATLRYTIAETVKGKVPNPMTGKAVETEMSIGFVGKGEFLVERGTWKTFVGRMKMSATGILNSQTFQDFAMAPMDAVPEALLKLE